MEAWEREETRLGTAIDLPRHGDNGTQGFHDRHGSHAVDGSHQPETASGREPNLQSPPVYAVAELPR